MTGIAVIVIYYASSSMDGVDRRGCDVDCVNRRGGDVDCID